MVAARNLTPKKKQLLETSVVDGLQERSIKARAELQASELKGRYQLFVVAPAFGRLSEAERQDVIWRVLQERWAREDQLRLTLVLGLSDREAAGAWA